MRVSLDQLSVEDPGDSPENVGASRSAAAPDSIGGAERPDHAEQLASASHSTTSDKPAESDKVAADDWGEFTGDVPAE